MKRFSNDGFYPHGDLGDIVQKGLLFENLIESIGDGILIVSPTAKPLYFNQHFVKIWKLPEALLQEESEEKALRWAAQQTVDPAGFVGGVSAIYADPFAQPVLDELMMKDGRIFDRCGAPAWKGRVHYGWIWVFRDITARRKAEQALRQQELSAQLTKGEKLERKRIVSLLHDDLQQVLVAARMRLNIAAMPIEQETTRQSIEQASIWINRAIDSTRNLGHELSSPDMHERGLAPSLEWLTNEMQTRYNLQVAFPNDTSGLTLRSEIWSLLYECIRELLFNVAKHAGVTNVTVSLGQDDEQLRVVIEDKGKGFDVIARLAGRAGLGLFSIEERLEKLGGEMLIDSAIGCGTRTELILPITATVEEPCPSAREGFHSHSSCDRHFVQFYEHDTELMNALTGFSRDGLRSLEKLVIIATPEHRDELEQHLRGEGVELDHAMAEGAYVALDAKETLRAFMNGEILDEDRFAASVESLLDGAGRPVRVFGEMVGLLQEAGHSGGAIRLEELWNELAQRHPFSLFCAYPIQIFSGSANEQVLRHICRAHDRVIPAASYSEQMSQQERAVAVTLLQQKALPSA